jgi:hypothetical protein
MSGITFTEHVHSQIALLVAGKPLEAFDQFFASDGMMFANGELFAGSAAEGRKKQEPYILAAKSILGVVDDLIIMEDQEICAFRNKTSFITNDDMQHRIDGLCWQRWRNGRIVEERYFDGEHMQSVISAGILQKPDVIEAVE